MATNTASTPPKVVLKNGSVIEKKDSALSVVLHPLVILNISDQWTRTRVQTVTENPRVIGALLGIQTGRNIEIFNSFEIVFHIDAKTKDVSIDPKYLSKKQEQFKKVFPTYDFLGWYSTSEAVIPADMDVHRSPSITDFNESPLYLILDTFACGRKVTKELPISVYESELHMLEGKPTNLFVKVPYKIETGEAERIAVDHVARITPTTGDGSVLAAHLLGVHNAIQMLSSRVKLLLQYLEAAKKGSVPKDHGVLRRVASLSYQLPATDSNAFKGDFLNEYNDALVITYLASITKGTTSTNELIEKFNATFERHSRRRPFL